MMVPDVEMHMRDLYQDNELSRYICTVDCSRGVIKFGGYILSVLLSVGEPPSTK
jgi:hypothetical protein